VYSYNKMEEDDKSGFEKDVSRNMTSTSKPVKLVAVPQSLPPVPRINDLVLELSPGEVEKQERELARKRSSGGVMSRFLCHCGLGERNVKLSLETNG
jgi:hypothetical protein